MAKLVTFFFILIALQAGMLLFGNPTTETTTIWEFVTNIDNWNSLKFIVGIGAVALTAYASALAAGNLFGFKTDFLMFAPAVTGFISMGVIIVNFATTIRNDLIARIFSECAYAPYTINTCPPVNLILAITVGPLAFYYLWTVVEWWRGKDF